MFAVSDEVRIWESTPQSRVTNHFVPCNNTRVRALLFEGSQHWDVIFWFLSHTSSLRSDEASRSRPTTPITLHRSVGATLRGLPTHSRSVDKCFAAAGRSLFNFSLHLLWFCSLFTPPGGSLFPNWFPLEGSLAMLVILRGNSAGSTYERRIPPFDVSAPDRKKSWRRQVHSHIYAL